MKEFLEIKMSGWTATPRMPFVLSGNAICMPVPSYSLLLGMIGCCLGRIVEPHEVGFGFHYQYDTTAQDLETRQRLEYDGKRIKQHSKGTDAYKREFHINPELVLWLNRTDWEDFFLNPIGTPSLGRSQDIMKIEEVRTIVVEEVEEARISATMLPFSTSMQVGGQLLQLAEAYQENDEIGGGRKPTHSMTFIAIPSMNSEQQNLPIVRMPNLYQIQGETQQCFYLHEFLNSPQ
jgi:CRISPR-associated protein Cas5t